MKIFKLILMGVFLASTPVLVTACEQDSALENAAEDIDEGIEEVQDEIDDATTN